MKLDVSFLFTNKKLGHQAIWVICRLPWECKDHQKRYFLRVQIAGSRKCQQCTQFSISCRNTFYSWVKAKKGCLCEVLESINPKYVVISHSLVMTPSSALPALL